LHSERKIANKDSNDFDWMLGGSAEKEEKHPIKVDDFEWMSFGQKASKNTENEKE